MADIRYARAGEVSVAYRTFGSGPLDIVEVGGLVTNLEIMDEWRDIARFYEHLGSFARVICFDKRGVGLSDRVPHISPEDVVDDILAVMDAAGSERAALYGREEGGALAALFAATHPDRTSALILYGTYPRRRWAPDYPWGISDETHAAVITAYTERWGRDPIGVRSAAPRLSQDPAFRAWWLRAQRLGASPASALTWFRMTAEIDVRELLPSIKVPTLALHRTRDRAFPVEGARFFAEHIPDARLVELPGEGHMIFDDDPSRVIDEIQEFLTGQRAEEPWDRDRALASILFTDIVSSTERASALGDRRWRALLDEHDRMAEKEVHRQRGRVVKTTGDGLLAVFDGPARAARCARSIIRSAADMDLDVRAGLHTGECELRGDDIGGIAVHLARRICDAAGPGEVVVSQTVKDLVVGSELTFDDRGEHVMKGAPGTWRLWAIVQP